MSTTTTTASAREPSVTAPTTDSVLGRHLLTVRGMHFVFGALGDPYAQRLRDEAGNVSLGERIREVGPLHHSSLGTHVTADADVADRLLRHPGLGTLHPAQEAAAEHARENVWESWHLCHVAPAASALLDLSPDRHERVAARVRPVLGDVSGRSWAPEAARATTRVLEGLNLPGDLMADLVRPIVTDALAAVLGFPESARVELRALLPTVGPTLDATLCPPRLPTARAMEAATDRLRQLTGVLVAARRNAPGPDAMSAMLAVEGDGAGTDTADALAVLMVAAAEATATTLGNAVIALLGHPQQWDMLCAEPEKSADAVEETLRWAPPITMVSRITQESVTVGSHVLESDQHVVVLIDAANRDPALHEDPDRFDILRPARPGFSHLSLTGTEYERLVAPLVRLQASVALREIAVRFPNLRMDGEPLRRPRSPVVRAPLRLPLRLEATQP